MPPWGLVETELVRVNLDEEVIAQWIWTMYGMQTDLGQGICTQVRQRMDTATGATRPCTV